MESNIRLLDLVGDLDLKVSYAAYIFEWSSETESELLYLDPSTNLLIQPSTGAIVPKQLDPPSLLNTHPPSAEFKIDGKAKTLDRALLLTPPTRRNYADFYGRFLGVFHYLDRVNFDLRTDPVLIESCIWNWSVFQQILERSTFFRQVNWLVIDQAYWIKHCIVIDNQAIDRVMVESLLDWLEVPRTVNVSYDENKHTNKVYLTRASNVTRSVINDAEIQVLVKRHGFRVVDLNGWKLEDQIQLFGRIDYLIGIHGAALANIIYRCNHHGDCSQDHVLSLIEIRPKQFGQRWVEYLSYVLGYKYMSMIAGPLVRLDGNTDNDQLTEAELVGYQYKTGFEINLRELEAQIIQLLSCAPRN